MAEGTGFEPMTTESKSVVLPITPTPNNKFVAGVDTSGHHPLPLLRVSQRLFATHLFDIKTLTTLFLKASDCPSH